MLLTLLLGDVFPGCFENLCHQRQQDDDVLGHVTCSRFVVHQMQHVERLSACHSVIYGIISYIRLINFDKTQSNTCRTVD